MKLRVRKGVWIPAVIFGLASMLSVGVAELEAHPADSGPATTQLAQAQPKTLPAIPGITAPDQKPNACVNCHKNYPGQFDGRLSTHVKEWASKGVDPHLLEKAQSTMPPGIKLSGKHPDVSAIVKVIPTDCLMCHSGSSPKVPQFRKLIHRIHLTGGEENHFLMNYGGTCTHCHKLDQDTGTWSIGSGTEEP